MKGKNKLVPRLLGITKESVLRLDEKTKEVGTRQPFARKQACQHFKVI